MARSLEALVALKLGELNWLLLQKMAECEMLHEKLKATEAERDAVKPTAEKT